MDLMFVEEKPSKEKEEKENLKITINRINKIVNEKKKEKEKYKNERDNYRNDYENAGFFNECNVKVNNLNNEIEELENLENNPYFGRVILETEKDEIDAYIGEKAIRDNDYIVYDWRAPIMGIFYSNQTSIEYREILYKLKIKRRLMIKNKTLLDCKEDYNNEGEDHFLNDNFLRQLIKSKKAEEGFTDIIKSIQYKQNDIIRERLNSNIICQGSAGSGKTAIIVHRISYLLFNNPSISADKFLFIAPNDNFKKELNELNKKLEIDKITLKTINEYYLDKLNEYIGENQKIKIIKVDDDLKQSEILNETEILNIFNKVKNYYLKSISEYEKKYEIEPKEYILPAIRSKNLYNYINEIIEKIRLNKNKLEIDIKNNLKNNKNMLSSCSVSLKLTSDEYKNKKMNENFKVEFRNKMNKKINYMKEMIGFLNKNKWNLKNIYKLKKYSEKLISLKQAKTLGEDIFILSDFVDNTHIKYDVSERNLPSEIKAFKNFCVKIIFQLMLDEEVINDKEIMISDIEKTNNLFEQFNENKSIEYEKIAKKLYIEIQPTQVLKMILFEIRKNDFESIENIAINRNEAFVILNILQKFGFEKSTNYKYIYIDEAQDYSDDEIVLIKNLEKGYLNVFGDINQNIKGAWFQRKNWSELKSKIKDEVRVYELNENYRNTINVVDFCNEELEENMLGVGVSGKDVEIRYFKEISEIIKEAQKSESVIITDNINYLKELKTKENIRCFSVKESKGLEFTNAIVIDDGLDKNSKYIAYTRTLNDLIIYRKN